jgi:hypothetical protein
VALEGDIMFISWTNVTMWQYGANINAQWASEKKNEITLTVLFGSASGPVGSGPASGTLSGPIETKTVALSINHNAPENVVLQQGSVVLDLNFTWESPEAGQDNPKINFNGNIIDGGVANVGIDAYLNVIL